MIAVLKADTTSQQTEHLIQWLQTLGLQVRVYQTNHTAVLGLIGDVDRIDPSLLQAMDIVERVQRVSEPFKQVSRQFHPDASVVNVSGVPVGGGNFVMIAGPCSVESEEQILRIADSVRCSGAQILRGGAFKPRTSPYAFQGLGPEGLRLLMAAKEATGLPVCTELTNIHHLPLFENVDLIQIGARNMQNFQLLKEVGKSKKPVLLKRGLSSTLEELLMSAEYIVSEGNEQVILCERGIRTFETRTRNTLDLSAIPALRELTHLPVIVDPSHGTGRASLVPPMALAATAAGADGVMIEVHNDPPRALSDGAQSLTPAQFREMTANIRRIREVLE